MADNFSIRGRGSKRRPFRNRAGPNRGNKRPNIERSRSRPRMDYPNHRSRSPPHMGYPNHRTRSPPHRGYPNHRSRSPPHMGYPIHRRRSPPHMEFSDHRSRSPHSPSHMGYPNQRSRSPAHIEFSDPRSRSPLHMSYPNHRSRSPPNMAYPNHRSRSPPNMAYPNHRSRSPPSPPNISYPDHRSRSPPRMDFPHHRSRSPPNMAYPNHRSRSPPSPPNISYPDHRSNSHPRMDFPHHRSRSPPNMAYPNHRRRSPPPPPNISYPDHRSRSPPNMAYPNHRSRSPPSPPNISYPDHRSRSPPRMDFSHHRSRSPPYNGSPIYAKTEPADDSPIHRGRAPPYSECLDHFSRSPPRTDHVRQETHNQPFYDRQSPMRPRDSVDNVDMRFGQGHDNRMDARNPTQSFNQSNVEYHEFIGNDRYLASSEMMRGDWDDNNDIPRLDRSRSDEQLIEPDTNTRYDSSSSILIGNRHANLDSYPPIPRDDPAYRRTYEHAEMRHSNFPSEMHREYMPDSDIQQTKPVDVARFGDQQTYGPESRRRNEPINFPNSSSGDMHGRNSGDSCEIFRHGRGSEGKSVRSEGPHRRADKRRTSRWSSPNRSEIGGRNQDDCSNIRQTDGLTYRKSASSSDPDRIDSSSSKIHKRSQPDNIENRPSKRARLNEQQISETEVKPTPKNKNKPGRWSARFNFPLPERGQPGGLDDPLRKGMNGPATKRYLILLHNGVKPEQAKLLAHTLTPNAVDEPGRKLWQKYSVLLEKPRGNLPEINQKALIAKEHIEELTAMETVPVVKHTVVEQRHCSNVVITNEPGVPGNKETINKDAIKNPHSEAALEKQSGNASANINNKTNKERQAANGYKATEKSPSRDTLGFVKNMSTIAKESKDEFAAVKNEAPCDTAPRTSSTSTRTVAIIARNHLSHPLTNHELMKIENALFDELITATEKKTFVEPIKFDGISYKSGSVHVNCKTTATVNWVKLIAPNLPGWKDRELLACSIEDIPQGNPSPCREPQQTNPDLIPLLTSCGNSSTIESKTQIENSTSSTQQAFTDTKPIEASVPKKLTPSALAFKERKAACRLLNRLQHIPDGSLSAKDRASKEWAVGVLKKKEERSAIAAGPEEDTYNRWTPIESENKPESNLLQTQGDFTSQTFSLSTGQAGQPSASSSSTAPAAHLALNPTGELSNNKFKYLREALEKRQWAQKTVDDLQNVPKQMVSESLQQQLKTATHILKVCASAPPKVMKQVSHVQLPKKSKKAKKREAAQQQQQQPPQPYSKSLVRAVIDRSQTYGNIDAESWKLVQLALQSRIAQLQLENPGTPPQFQDAGWFLDRVKLISCADQRSADFLANAVKNLDVWPGAQLEVVLKKDVPRNPRCRTWLPEYPETPGDILQMLKASNPGLPTSTWQVVKLDKCRQGKREAVIIVNMESLPLLSKRRGMVHLGFTSIVLHNIVPRN